MTDTIKLAKEAAPFSLYLASCALCLTAMWFAPSVYWVLAGYFAGVGVSTAFAMKRTARIRSAASKGST